MTDPTDLIARADAAMDGVTPGPWTIDDEGDAIIGPEFSDYEIELVTGFYSDKDMHFIAASRQLFPALRDALAAALARAEAAECHAEAMEAERDRLPQVKPLVWEVPSASNNWIYQAHSPWGTYGVHICGGKHQAWLEAHKKPYEQWLGDGYVGSVIEAQSVADQDHRQRVLDLLCTRAALTAQEPQP